MTMRSAGIILHRKRRGRVEIFLVHPGGPYWATRNEGGWSIPKGLVGPHEDPLAAAQREFQEETGFVLEGAFTPLGTSRLSGDKQLEAWAIGGDLKPGQLKSNSLELIWPPKSGQLQRFPEVDRGAWFGRDAALVHVHKGQRALIEAFFLQAPGGIDLPQQRSSRDR